MWASLINAAAAQAGNGELARQAVAEMERMPLGHKGYETELGLARSWSATAATGYRPATCRAPARLRARPASWRSRAAQDAYAMRALHDLAGQALRPISGYDARTLANDLGSQLAYGLTTAATFKPVSRPG